MKLSITCGIFLLGHLVAYAQTATLRGQVLDAFNRQPLAGAHIEVEGTGVVAGTYADEAGQFRFDHLSAGYYTLTVSFVGYDTTTFSDVLASIGKDVVLAIALRENVTALQEVVVTADENPMVPLNTLALASARSFSVAETGRYAGAINDPARMALAYAGVNGGHADRNDIIIRGNSPRGLLWRLEGIEIPNPNHFALEGSSGGLISILGSEALTDSDFYTGAFPANIGNAYSGVFDLRLRNGNEEKREFSLEAGLLGIKASAEGPLRKNSRVAYRITYRHSSLGLLRELGVIGEAPRFGDVSFKLHMPTARNGQFSIFGLAGRGTWSEKEQFRYLTTDSSSYVIINGDTIYGRPVETEIEDLQRYEMGFTGIRHGMALGKNVYLQSYTAVSGTRNLPYHSEFDRQLRQPYLARDGAYRNTAWRTGATLYHKLNRRLQWQYGMVYSRLGYRLRVREGSRDGVVREVLNEKGSGTFSQLFTAAHLRLRPQLVISAGVQAVHFSVNHNFRLEPRMAVRWTLTPKQALSFAFGEHSRHEAMATYLGRQIQTDGTSNQPNTDLTMMKARHFVLGYDLRLAPDLFFKLEGYHQYLYDVPVDEAPGSAYSALNEEVAFTTRALSNSGSGQNTGVECTLEKTFTRQRYFMFSAALFDATYRMPDGTVRNSKYNLNRSANLLGGKEFTLGQRTLPRVFGVNFRLTYTGGKRIIPINFEASKAAGVEIRREADAYEEQLDDFYRVDVGMYLRLAGRTATHQVKLDVLNLMEHNVYDQQFVPAQTIRGITTEASIRNVHYGDGGNTRLPVLSYRVDF